MRGLTLFAALLSTTAAAAVEERSTSGCRDFNIPVTAHAKNKLIVSPAHDLTTAAGVTSFLSSLAGGGGDLFAELDQGGSFPISARYCAPLSNADAPAARANHVQLLLHGIPYTKNYWLGNVGETTGDAKYSWEGHMRAQGYPVLSIDNLGNGNSTVHPDPVLTVQQPLEAAIVHQIVMKMRAGTIGHGVPKANKVIWGSHSYASALGNNVMLNFPQDFDAALLTGYTYTLANGVPGALLAQLEPASLYNPKKYGHLDPAYITFGSRHGKRETYYAASDDFNHKLSDIDFDNQGITTIGEIVTFFTGMQVAPKFKGDVMVITGEADALFCGLGSRTLQPKPSCGKGKTSIPAKTGQFFPNANYHYYIPPGTSHATNLHHSSQSIFKQASAFLAQNGY